MQSRGLFPGIALITLGVIILGEKLDWFHLDWGFFARFWPLLLVLAGINLILRRQNSSAAIFTTVLLAVAVPLAVISAFRGNDWDGDRWDNHDRFEWRSDEGESDEEDMNSDSDTDSEVRVRSDNFSEPMSSDIREASLKFEGGAGSFNIGVPTDSLIQASTRVNVTSYSMTVNRELETGKADISLELEDDKINIKDGKLENRVDLKLNAAPAWNFDLDFGAGQADLDLSAYAVKSLKMDTGAADIDLKLGDKAAATDIDIESGVASITVKVPQTVGCQIESKGALNVSKFVGFNEISSGIYQSPGYAQATKKITIRYEGGVSRFRVERY